MVGKIIDMHAHLANYKIYPEYWKKGIMGNMFEYLKNRPDVDIIVDKLIKSSLNDFDCKKLITSMDQAGINKTCIMLADFGYGTKDMEFSLEDIYIEHSNSISEYKDRIMVFGGCDPRRGKLGYDLFEKGIKKLGFCGLKLYPPCGFELDDKQLFPLYEICNQYKLPILIHIGVSLDTMKKTFNFPKSLQNIIHKYPDAIFIMGHGGIQAFDECYKLPLMYHNVYLELSGFQNYIQNREEVKKKMEFMCQNYPHRILFGTDWPLFQSQEKAVKMVLDMEYLDVNNKECILFKNAESIIN